MTGDTEQTISSEVKSQRQRDSQLNWNEFIWYPIARCELDRIKVKPKIKGIIIFYLDKLNNWRFYFTNARHFGTCARHFGTRTIRHFCVFFFDFTYKTSNSLEQIPNFNHVCSGEKIPIMPILILIHLQLLMKRNDSYYLSSW